MDHIGTFTVIAAMVLAAMYAINAAVLVGFAKVTLWSKIFGWAVLTGWAAIIIAVAAWGGFEPGVLGILPTPVVAFAVIVLAWLVGWYAWPGFRKALGSLPLAALVGVNALRLGGVFFLILWAQGQLSAPFAPSAGWGDIITAAAAIFLAIAAAGFLPLSYKLLKAWNALGALDLIVAVTLAFFSVPGAPWRLFMDPPGTAIFGALPWVGVATMLVPLYLMTHFVIWQKLRGVSKASIGGGL